MSLRTTLRSGLTVALLALLVLTLWPRGVPLMARVQASVINPYKTEALLAPYAAYRSALGSGDLGNVTRILDDDVVAGSYLEYRIHRDLMEVSALPEAQRARHAQRALALTPQDPLAAADTRRAQLAYARLAEQAGLTAEAIGAYTAALPLETALGGLKRLETSPYRLANTLLRARQYREALAALGARQAPAVEAPAYRALGEHTRALAAYERWLREDPRNDTARHGQAWSLLALGQNAEADALFAALDSPDARYGRGIVARRAGNTGGAVAWFVASGIDRVMWAATDLLEAEGRDAEAIPIYLEIAKQSGSSYAPGAAFRALTLAEQQGSREWAAQAEALLPPLSYLGRRHGLPLEVPSELSDPPRTHPALALAAALMRVNDRDAALGELLFALREATDEATTIVLAEALQDLGEFRQSQRAAEAYLNQGSQDRRIWQLAYPRAYPALVAGEATFWDVEPALVWAIMREESRFYPRAVSVSNAQGLMQVIPSTWDWIAELLREPPGDTFDPADNIRYGTYYLRRLLNQFGGDLERVVPAYNGGPGYISRLYAAPPVGGNNDQLIRFIDKTETREYLQKVLLSYEIYRDLYNPPY